MQKVVVKIYFGKCSKIVSSRYEHNDFGDFGNVHGVMMEVLDKVQFRVYQSLVTNL